MNKPSTDSELDALAARTAAQMTAMIIQVEQVEVYGQPAFLPGKQYPPVDLPWIARDHWRRRRKAWAKARAEARTQQP